MHPFTRIKFKIDIGTEDDVELDEELWDWTVININDDPHNYLLELLLITQQRKQYGVRAYHLRVTL